MMIAVASPTAPRHTAAMAGRSVPDRHEEAAFRYVAATCAAAARLAPAPPLPGGVPASALMALAIRHRLAAPVLDRLADAARASDPAAAAALDERARDRRFIALDHARTVAALTRALTANGIRHLVVKGAVLAQQLYGDVTARDSKDVDVLIDPAQFDAATAVLRDRGYGEATPAAGVGDDGGKHATFRDGEIEIEVHARLLDTLDFVPLTFERLWARRVAVPLAAAAIDTLSTVDTLLYLSAHGGEHCWFRLKWLQDIARILAVGDAAALAEAIATAQREGHDRLVGAAMILVRDLFATATPAMAEDRSMRRLAALSKAALKAPAALASEPTLGWLVRRSLVQLGLRRHWHGRAAFLRHLVTSRRSFDDASPAGSRWHAHLSRPIRLLRHRRLR